MPGYRITKHSGLFFFFSMYKSRVQMQQESKICELFFFHETIRLLLSFCWKNLYRNKSSIKIHVHCVQGIILNNSCNLFELYSCIRAEDELLGSKYSGLNLSPLHKLTANETLLTSCTSLAKTQHGVLVFPGALTTARTENPSPGFKS